MEVDHEFGDIGLLKFIMEPSVILENKRRYTHAFSLNIWISWVEFDMFLYLININCFNNRIFDL